MRSTFKIAGPGSAGTAFFIGRPSPNDKTRFFFVLVTAAHVLRDMQGEQAILFLRKKQGDEFVKFPYPVQIRRGSKPVWMEHPTADVAVMYVPLPKDADIQLVPMTLLVTDSQLEELGMHPGDVLSCLGYPYGAEANEAGFPILRSGQIASYPLTPVSRTRTFLFDFRVFQGNSGGPVYYDAGIRSHGIAGFSVGSFRFIAGLVTEERVVTEEIHSLTETRKTDHPLGLAVVVHAALIREAIELLPPLAESEEKPER